MLSKRSTFRTSVLALLLLCGSLRAAELGEVKVNSHIGQQLSADIELVDLMQADLAELQARLANPDVFKGAGLEMPPELGGLYIAIAKRDNKRFLHLTTLQPVKAEALHLFLELSSGGRQIIRATSLWLTPEPPAARVAEPPAAPMPATATAALGAPAAVVAPAQSQSGGEDGLSEAARRAFAYRRQKALEQAQARAAAQDAPPAAALPAPATAPAPVPTRAPAPPASSTIASVRHMPAQASSCAPAKQVEAQIQQCQAMTSKLTDIEDKVRRLQDAIAAPAPAAAAKAAAPAALPPPVPKTEAAAAKPSSAPSKPGATPVKPGVAADLAGNSRKRLMMIAAGVLAGLAALGGAIFFMRRRQAKGPLRIWQSFRKKDAVLAEEAAPEEAEQQLAAQ